MSPRQSQEQAYDNDIISEYNTVISQCAGVSGSL